MTAPWSPDIDRAVRGGPRAGSLEEWKAHAQSLLARQPCVFVRNGQISALYAALYLRRPELFKWAGLAAIASRHIRVALWPLRWGAAGDEIDLPRALGRWQALRMADADRIRRTNNDIFDDIFWAHLVYDGDPRGLGELERLAEGTAHAPIAEAFRRMDAGRRRLPNVPQAVDMVWDANVRILEHEQRVMVQPNFDRLSCAYARAFSFGATAGLDVDGLRRLGSVLTSFYGYSLRRGSRPSGRSGLPLLTSFDDRWAWLEGSIMPRFRRHEGMGDGLRRTLATIVQEARGRRPHVAPGAGVA